MTGKVVHHHHGPVPKATASLPAAPALFTGRDHDLVRLSATLDPSAESELPVLVCAVSGLAGVGKTSLALHAAHRAGEDGWFPGGMLFVDLRGYDDHPVTAGQAVLALLDALGIRGTELPATSDGQYALYRSLLAREQAPLLLVLDNASHAEQITPLLPGLRHHRVLVTSRNRLTDLDARIVDLDVLTEEAAIGLITKALRLSDAHDDRPAREPDAVRKLAALCGCLPLSLRMVAGVLRRQRHRSLSSLVEEISAASDSTRALGVRSVLDVSYARLPRAQARLLRLLALAPAADICTEAAAALVRRPPDLVRGLLEELANAYLITAPADGARDLRWRSHDLVRAYAATLNAGNRLRAPGREQARARMLNFYCRRAHAAVLRVHWTPGLPEPDFFSESEEALAWLDAERHALVSLAQEAEGAWYASAAISLALSLAPFLACDGTSATWSQSAGQLRGRRTAGATAGARPSRAPTSVARCRTWDRRRRRSTPTSRRARCSGTSTTAKARPRPCTTSATHS
ncbi:NB-ARC domain-containing protein [Streptomyces cinerochromogenes]|uniref:NB-ARC domain-containing protein n=1 Tax=Streptomyces cinerochromogenes TaxID=66422 RepID=UPI0033BBCF4B